MYPATTARFVTARRSAARLSAAALLLAPTLTSCALISPAADPAAPSHESSAAPAPTPTQTTPAAPTPSSAPVKTFDPQAPQPFIIKDRQPPVLSDVARQPDGEGAEAFAYFILDAWIYALSTNDIEWFSSNVVGNSRTLAQMHRTITDNTLEQYVVQTTLSNVRTADRRVNLDDETEYLILLEFDTGPRIEMHSDGRRIEQAGPTRSLLTCSMRPNKDSIWEITGLAIEESE
ncbi:MAG: DUF6318 family protein [Buchananella hordeovulneris]|nr:DUF6318 family protein [Buchananella hordeovulneris]